MSKDYDTLLAGAVAADHAAHDARENADRAAFNAVDASAQLPYADDSDDPKYTTLAKAADDATKDAEEAEQAALDALDALDACSLFIKNA